MTTSPELPRRSRQSLALDENAFLSASLPSEYTFQQKRPSEPDSNILFHTVSPAFTRQRSASVHSGKRSLRLPKGRSSSFRLHRRKSEGGEASTVTLDSAFAKARKQLADLTTEDQSLKERIDKLSEDINDLWSRSISRQNFPPSQKSKKTARPLPPTLMVSNSRENILFSLEPAWEAKETKPPLGTPSDLSLHHTCVLKATVPTGDEVDVLS